jgi:hypothetical protein
MGMVHRRLIYKPLLTKSHRAKRRSYAAKFSCWSVPKWQDVIFSDEKMFRIRLCKKISGWRPKTASKFEAKYRIPSVGKPDGLMVWAAMNGSGDIILRRMPSKVNSQAYIDVLQSAKAFVQPKYAWK